MRFLSLIVLSSINIFGSSYVHNCDKVYSIQIWDAHYSMAFTNVYTITNKYISVKRISGIEGDKDSVLLKRDIDEKECSMILDFLEQHKLDRLKDSYSDPYVEDGNQKKVKIKINNKAKTIKLANTYQKDLAELYATINKLLNASLAIKY